MTEQMLQVTKSANKIRCPYCVKVLSEIDIAEIEKDEDRTRYVYYCSFCKQDSEKVEYA